MLLIQVGILVSFISYRYVVSDLVQQPYSWVGQIVLGNWVKIRSVLECYAATLSLIQSKKAPEA